MRLTSNTLRNRVDLYHNTPILTATTGASFIGAGTEYPAPYASGVRASVQPAEPHGGVHRSLQSGTVDWNVYFGTAPGLNPTDLIVWVDGDTTRYLVVAVVVNLAGRSGAWRAECYERIS